MSGTHLIMEYSVNIPKDDTSHFRPTLYQFPTNC